MKSVTYTRALISLYQAPDSELVGKGVIIAEGKAGSTRHQHRLKKWHRLKKLKKTTWKLKVAELKKELLEKSGVRIWSGRQKADLVALAQTIEGE